MVASVSAMLKARMMMDLVPCWWADDQVTGASGGPVMYPMALAGPGVEEPMLHRSGAAGGRQSVGPPHVEVSFPHAPPEFFTSWPRISADASPEPFWLN